MKAVIILFLLLSSTIVTTSSSVLAIGSMHYTPTTTNATQSLTNMLGRLTFVVNVIAGSIIGVVWIYEALFLIMHKDDKEGILKFKRDLPIMVLATVIIFGAATIVNVLSWIGQG